MAFHWITSRRVRCKGVDWKPRPRNVETGLGRYGTSALQRLAFWALRGHILPLLGITGYTLLLLYKQRLWGPDGLAVGDDFYTHAGYAEFVLRNWPETGWFPAWYGGLPIFQAYPSVLAHLWAALSYILGQAPVDLIQGLTILNFILVGVGLYGTVYVATRSRILAFVTPLFVLISPGYFELISVGGAYTRLQGLVFLAFALCSLVLYARHRSTTPLVSAGVLLGLTAATDVPVAQQAAVFVCLFFLFLGGSFKEKVRDFALLGAIAAGISAFFVVPFLGYAVPRIIAFSQAGGNAGTPIPVRQLVDNVFAPVSVAVAAYVIWWVKGTRGSIGLVLQRSTLAIMILLVIYATADLPVRWFATYDTLQFLPLWVSLLAAVTLSTVFTSSSERSLGATSRRLVFGGRVILLALFAFLIAVPFSSLRGYSIVDVGSPNLTNASYVANLLSNFDYEESKLHRMATDWIQVQRWYTYAYPDSPQTAGIYPAAAVDSLWGEHFAKQVFRSSENMPETLFWIDWFGVKWLLLNNVVDPFGGGSRLVERAEKFLTHPSFRVDKEVPLQPGSYWANFGTGSAYTVVYDGARSLVEAVDSPAVLFFGSEDDYQNLFLSMSLLGLAATDIVPIYAGERVGQLSLDLLNTFDAVVLCNPQDQTQERVIANLNTYVRQGGGLMVVGGCAVADHFPDPSPVIKGSSLEATRWVLAGRGAMVLRPETIGFTPDNPVLGASAEDMRSGAAAWLVNDGKSVIAMRDLGEGRIIWSGLDLPATSAAHEVIQVQLFIDLLRFLSRSSAALSPLPTPQEIDIMDPTSWQSFGKGEGVLAVADKNSLPPGIGKGLNLDYRLTEAGTWVEKRVVFPAHYDWNQANGIAFWLRSDGSDSTLKVIVLMPTWDRFGQTFIPLDFTGWKPINLPFNSLGTNAGLHLGDIGGLSLSIMSGPLDAASGGIVLTTPVLTVPNTVPRRAEGVPVSFGRPRAGKLVIAIDQPTKGVLVREAFDGNWRATITNGNDDRESLPIFSSGPGFMYVPLSPQDTGQLSLTYHIPAVQRFAFVLSMFTVAFVGSYFGHQLMGTSLYKEKLKPELAPIGLLGAKAASNVQLVLVRIKNVLFHLAVRRSVKEEQKRKK